jgi:D-tyrosyl-tRNA(Tyr) deacylase
MSSPSAIVCFLCTNPDKDPVAPHVTDVLIDEHAPEPTGMVVDSVDVLLARPPTGVELFIVRTAEVIAHDYPHYLPIMNDLFADADAAVVVNWHAGANAPDRILTAHSTGDVVAGAWASTDPRQLSNLLTSLNRERAGQSLDEFAVLVEATHWAGVQYGCAAARVEEYRVPLYDVEIGSSPQSWSDSRAVRALARALEHVDDHDPSVDAVSVLCGGGVHCERAFSDPVLTPGDHKIAISHILPNHWLVAGRYDDPVTADKRLDDCVASIAGGVDLVAVHEKLKSSYKDAFRRLAARLDVPVVKHKALKQPLALG